MHRRLPTFASISATALAIVVASAFPAHAQNGTWSSLPADAPNLGPRREFGAIFDRANQRYLTFDGFNGNNYGLYILFNDVWELSVAGDPPVWSNITFTGTVPGARHTPQWGYDAARNRVLMFGGYGSHYPGYPYAYLDDVWELDLDGTPHWRELFPAGQAPSGRLAGAAVFDPIRQRFVGFGGTIGVPVDTWSLNLQGQANWELVPTNGAAPKGGYGMTSVYDARGDRLLMFGGSINDNYYYANNDVWELDLHGNPTWHLVVTAGTPPQARRSGTAIWDPPRKGMGIYGGGGAHSFPGQHPAVAPGGSGGTAATGAPLGHCDLGSAAKSHGDLRRVRRHSLLGPIPAGHLGARLQHRDADVDAARPRRNDAGGSRRQRGRLRPDPRSHDLLWRLGREQHAERHPVPQLGLVHGGSRARADGRCHPELRARGLERQRNDRNARRHLPPRPGRRLVRARRG